MVIGSPYNFFVICQIINEWNNDNTYNNGVLLFAIDGEIFPKEIINMSLNTEISRLIDKMHNVKENTILFDGEKDTVIKEMYKTTFPDDINSDNDYSYLMTPFGMQDNDNFIFAVRKENKKRLLATKIEYDLEESTHTFNEMHVIETYITVEEMEYVANGLDRHVSAARNYVI